MIVQRYDGQDIRKILTAMVLDKSVCSRVAAQWPADGDGLFSASWANIAAGMIVRYYKKYNETPKNHMVAMYEDWAKSTLASDEDVKSVREFLQAVSDEGHQDASGYVLDLARRHFNKTNMDRAILAAKDALDNWQVEEAEQILTARRSVNLGTGAYDVPLRDFEMWSEAFSPDLSMPLISYRGALGELVGNAFQRGRLFSFMAPDKTGKTAWMVDLVFRGLESRLYVAYIDCGDSQRRDFLRRLGGRSLQRPVVSGICDFPSEWDKDGLVHLSKHRDAVTDIDAFNELRSMGCNEEALRTKFYPSSTLSADDVENILVEWDEQEDWRPDMIILDYADILAPPKGVRDSIDQIDETWKRLRRISQSRHCMVVTATQTSSLAYKDSGQLLTKKHFSGRKTKLAHVDGMLGIVQTADEKEEGICRVNWIVRRAGASNEKHYVEVAGNMATAQPVIISRWGYPKKDRDDAPSSQAV